MTEVFWCMSSSIRLFCQGILRLLQTVEESGNGKASVEERLATVEQELARLKQQLAMDKPQTTMPWWEQRFGTFANSEGYEEAMRLGREYRESLRPKHDGDGLEDSRHCPRQQRYSLHSQAR